MPYLFIDDETVAGGDDLDDMAAEGYLKELLLEKGRTSKKAATTAGRCKLSAACLRPIMDRKAYVRFQMVKEVN